MDDLLGTSADHEGFADLIEQMGLGYIEHKLIDVERQQEDLVDDIFADPLELDDCEEFDEIVSSYMEQKMNDTVADL